MDSGQATYELSPQKLVPLVGCKPNVFKSTHTIATQDAITQRAREFPTSRSACRLDQAASIFNAPLFDLHDDFNSTNRDLDSTPDLCLTFARSAAITFKQEARKIHIHNSTPKLCLNNSRFNLDVVLNMDGVGLNMDRVRLESDSGLKLTRIPSTPTSRRRNYASTARGPLVWAGVGAWFNFKALELIQRPAMPGSTQVQSQALYRRTEHLALTQHAIELTTTYLESRDSEIHFVATPRLCEFEPSQRKNNIEWTPTNQNSRISQGSSPSGYAQEEERTALCTRIPRSEVSERRACEKVESALSDGQHSGDTERARASGAARDDLFEAALLAGGRSEARAQAGALQHRHNGGSRRPRHSTALTALESERGWCALHAVADWRAACVREWRMARMEDEACAMRMFEGRRLCARTSNARRCADRAGVDARTEQGPERGRARRWWTNEMYDVRSLAKEKQARQTYLRRRRRDKTTCGEGRINGALAALVTCLVSVTLNTHLILVQKPPQTMTSFKKIFMKIAVAVKKAAAKVKTSGATVAPRTVAPFLGPPPAYVPPPSYEEATDPGPKERENDLLALDH
ncbi:hypothetical protein DFH06DRAFT_1153866 [Mycena polygramma]|nr:hypothetical protein DFH06DRAFT_1153866 [Mycena polygramma]